MSFNILQYFPGQEATIFLEISDGYDGYDGYHYHDGYHVRLDAVSLPVVNKIYLPNLTLMDSYPKFMTKLSTGLYYFKFIIPKGAVAIGSYLADISYINPLNNSLTNVAYQIIVLSPFGNFGITTQ